MGYSPVGEAWNVKRLGREREAWEAKVYEPASDAGGLIALVSKMNVFGVGEMMFIGGAPMGAAVQ